MDDNRNELVSLREFYAAAANPSSTEAFADILDHVITVCNRVSERSRSKKHGHHHNGHRKNRRYSGSASIKVSHSMPVLLSNGTSTERAIRSDLNKLAVSNYDLILRRLRFVSDCDIKFTVTSALEKSYLDPSHNTLYVRLFSDLFDTLNADTREQAVGIVKEQMPSVEVLRQEVMVPRTDPVRDYDKFCNICKMKRRVIGRCSTFANLLGSPLISESIHASPDDVYESHEIVLKDIIKSSGNVGDDTDFEGAVEIMLDSIATVTQTSNRIIGRFRDVVEDIGVDSFPSNRSRFKIMDILGS